MASLVPAEAREELPQDVLDQVDAAESGEEEEGPKVEETEAIVVPSRRKKREQENQARIAEAERAAAARDAEARELREQLQRTREETAQMRGMLEQLGRQQQAPRETAAPAEDIDAEIRKEMKRQQSALAGPQADFAEYQESQARMMELQARKIWAAQPKPQPVQQAPQQPQKPDWVRAIEYQYPDVLTHSQGQAAVGHFDQLSGTLGMAFGPERLHKAFQRARVELGLAQQAAPTNGARQLLSGGQFGDGGGQRKKPGERSVNIPREHLARMLKAGMTKAEAAKAWAESYPDEVA